MGFLLALANVELISAVIGLVVGVPVGVATIWTAFDIWGWRSWKSWVSPLPAYFVGLYTARAVSWVAEGFAIWLTETGLWVL
mgnify:CR=1 FL=1